mgnify:FL=1
MAVVNLSGTASYPAIKKLSSVGTTQQEITLPPGKLTVSVGSSTAVIDVCTSGVTDGAAMPTDKVFVPSGNLLSLNFGHSSGDKVSSIAVAAQTGTADIVVVIERG